jgi:hypothetical protein
MTKPRFVSVCEYCGFATTDATEDDGSYTPSSGIMKIHFQRHMNEPDPSSGLRWRTYDVGVECNDNTDAIE